MLDRLRRRRGQEGFTLIELLVVVIIIGLLAAIAIPAFLGQRNKANDAAAKSLVRNAATAMEAYFSDGNTYAGATATNLGTIEPNIVWQTTAADAASDQVNFGTPTATTFTLSTVSKSGTTYSYAKNLGAAAGTSTVSRTCNPTTACTSNGVAGNW
jgi:type IV pilus assembly protein PilA